MLWLVRHAKPLLPPGLCYGALDMQADAALTQAAAQRLAAVLPKDVPVQVLASPLRRCVQLAECLHGLRPDLPFATDVRLQEMDFGSWEGRALVRHTPRRRGRVGGQLCQPPLWRQGIRQRRATAPCRSLGRHAPCANSLRPARPCAMDYPQGHSPGRHPVIPRPAPGAAGGRLAQCGAGLWGLDMPAASAMSHGAACGILAHEKFPVGCCAKSQHPSGCAEGAGFLGRCLGWRRWAQSRNPSPLANAPAWNPAPSAHPDGYCDFAQYDGRRHSRSNRRTQTSSFRAQSRNPSPLANAPAWNPVPSAHPDGYCDFAQYDGRRHSRGSCVLQTGSNRRHKLHHSRSNRRTQTSSFRAQSRNPSPLANAPAWNPVPSAHPDGYCDFAQYDGRRHSRSSRVLQTGSNRHHKLHHSRSNRRTQTSSFRAQSRNPSPLANAPAWNPAPSAHPDGYCDFAQYDGRRHSRGSCVLQTGSNRRHKLHHSRSNRRTQTSSFRIPRLRAE